MTFPQMADRIPEGRCGKAEVTHFDVTEMESRLTAIRREYVPVGRYASLRVNGRLMMTDTPMERQTNWHFATHANGRVLIAGLGLGMILDPVIEKETVASVEVIEKSADVIALVGPHFVHPKLTTIHDDIFEWKPPRGQMWDTIYFDIWPDLCADNLDEMATLHRRFARRLDRTNSRAWMGSWGRETLQRRRRRDQRSAFAWR